jgi:hypothetical protein
MFPNIFKCVAVAQDPFGGFVLSTG